MTLPKIITRTPQAEDLLGSDLHPLLKRILLNRGINKPALLQHDLKDLPDPSLLRDMDKAVERLYQALTQQQNIMIVGDFDADGVTSTALMLLVLSKMGFENVRFTVPNRFEYGYGLSEKIVHEIAGGSQRKSIDVIITVDNGISSVEGVAAANNYGVDVIITDHHLAPEILPQALAIINPNQSGCEFPAKNTAGVGVAFYTLIALRKKLREKNWFAEQLIDEPNLAEYLDLVALGTVADVVPLDRYNRILVQQGLRRMRAGKMRTGLQKLLQLSGKEPRFLTASDMGFAIAPRLNAAGRLDDMTQGILLLTTESEDLALEFARVLDEFNSDRKMIEQQMQQEALTIVEQLTENLTEIPLGFCLYHPEWHQGVVGLVASRIKEKYHRPVIAFAKADSDDPNELKGSGRSIKGLHLRDALDVVATDNDGLLQKFGGHAMAAGLSLSLEQLPAFEKAFLKVLEGISDSSIFEQQLAVDGAIDGRDFNLYTAQLLRDVMPWGQQLPAPSFQGQFEVLNSRVLTGKHLKLQVKPQTDSHAYAIDAIWFNADEQYLETPPEQVDMVYRLEINHFRGEQKLQLMVEALAT